MDLTLYLARTILTSSSLTSRMDLTLYLARTILTSSSLTRGMDLTLYLARSSLERAADMTLRLRWEGALKWAFLVRRDWDETAEFCLAIFGVLMFLREKKISVSST